MSLPMTVLAGWIASASVMALLWLRQRARGNAGIVDVAWSFGTAALGMGFAWSADQRTTSAFFPWPPAEGRAR